MKLKEKRQSPKEIWYVPVEKGRPGLDCPLSYARVRVEKEEDMVVVVDCCLRVNISYGESQQNEGKGLLPCALENEKETRRSSY